MTTELTKALKKLCSIRNGSGSTAKSVYITVKEPSDENVESAEILILTLYGKAARVGSSTFVVAV